MAAFTAATILTLYFNAKLKAFSDYHTSAWKMLAVGTPLLLATFIAVIIIIEHVSADGVHILIVKSRSLPLALQQGFSTNA